MLLNVKTLEAALPCFQPACRSNWHTVKARWPRAGPLHSKIYRRHLAALKSVSATAYRSGTMVIDMTGRSPAHVVAYCAHTPRHGLQRTCAQRRP